MKDMIPPLRSMKGFSPMKKSRTAHARRKFTDASKVSKSKSHEEAVKMIRDIYRTDNAIREKAKSDEEIIRLRKENLPPLFEKFHA